MSSYTETYERVASASGADAFVNKLAIHSGLLPVIREVVVRPLSTAAL